MSKGPRITAPRDTFCGVRDNVPVFDAGGEGGLGKNPWIKSKTLINFDKVTFRNNCILSVSSGKQPYPLNKIQDQWAFGHLKSRDRRSESCRSQTVRGLFYYTEENKESRPKIGFQSNWAKETKILAV